MKSWAFMRAHQVPVAIGFHLLHEQIRNPQGIEEIPCSLFILKKSTVNLSFNNYEAYTTIKHYQIHLL